MSTLKAIKATLNKANLESNDNVVNLYIESVASLSFCDGVERQNGMSDLIGQGFDRLALEVTNDYVCSYDRY